MIWPAMEPVLSLSPLCSPQAPREQWQVDHPLPEHLIEINGGHRRLRL
jgi:hypothetical protein